MAAMDSQTYQHEFFDTTSATDFVFKNVPAPPAGYPDRPRPDTYAATPFAATYDERREAFCEHVLKNPAGGGIKGYYYELVRLFKGQGPVHEGLIRAALTYIDERYDCADFVLLGIMRLIHQFHASPLLSPGFMDAVKRTILGFKYWPDEPGIDSMCTWTENHQIMFAVNEYLAGQLFPERVFKNSGLTGTEKMRRAKPRIMQWLKLRYQTGFSEWLSHVYYDEDITALVNLIDFSQDPDIVRQATIVLDLIFLDMALNSFKGAFGCTHGRSYTQEKMDAAKESTTDTAKLLFGTGTFSGRDNMSAVSLALSDKYRLPPAICAIANDSARPEMENHQRMGIKIREAARWGLDIKNPDDVMTLLSLEAYAHPLTFAGVIGLFDRYNWWENQFFGMFKAQRGLIRFLLRSGLHHVFTRMLAKDMTRNTREEVNICTYRTPDYMLSAAVDYRQGYGGDQQHIWQATLGPLAVCFTTHPGNREDSSAGFWVGSGTLPRVAQFKNVLIALYRIARLPGIYMTNKLFFTHAYFPRDRFDEVKEQGGWIFGRKDDGYIALYSQRGYRWQTSGEFANREVIAAGLSNIWVCEMGRMAQDGSFADFIAKIVRAPLVCDRDNIRYASPSLGEIAFGWEGEFMVKGSPVALRDFPRYENPYAYAVFPPEEITIRHGEHRLRLDFGRGIRDK